LPDLLVRLYDMPPAAMAADALGDQGIIVRRAMAADRATVLAFARAHGSEAWVGECEAAFARQPVACFVAVVRGEATAVGYRREPEPLVGFAAYDAAAKGFFGPEVVDPAWRGRGVGRGLVLAALEAMRADGYGYAIIGWAASIEFYRKAVGATVIEGSEPGLYPPPLKL
jgi:GNAT superfamily N-acetyltransferase